jgi:hypothetical protein
MMFHCKKGYPLETHDKWYMFSTWDICFHMSWYRTYTKVDAMVHFLSCFWVYPQCHMAKYDMQELTSWYKLIMVGVHSLKLFRFDCVIFCLHVFLVT